MNVALMAIGFAFAALVAGLLLAAGYELGRRSGGPAAPLPRPALPFSRARAPEKRRPLVNSDERAWQIEKDEREGKARPPTP